MNENKFESGIERRWGRNRSRNGNLWTGFFLLLIGGLLLAKTSGVIFPVWFFTWPMILIGVGLFIGLRHGFRPGGWIVMLIVGGVFLAERITESSEVRPYLWPILLIAAGLFIMLKPRGWGNRRCRHRKDERTADGARSTNHQFENSNYTNKAEDAFTSEDTSKESGSNDNAAPHYADFLDVTAIFGGIKKKVLSKNFKGGDVLAIMGGTEINLTQADFNGRIMIDSFTMFGGNKLIIPPDWEVQSDVVAIFGGIEDKRPPATQQNSGKTIFLDGTCLFGGIEIKSF